MKLKVTEGPNSGPRGFSWGDWIGNIQLPNISKDAALQIAKDLTELQLWSDNSNYYFEVEDDS